MADKYIIRVTAGAGYDISQHQVVPVNTSQPTRVEHAGMHSSVSVRVQKYTGLPRGSPETSPYFSTSEHVGDTYSIALNFTPRRESAGGSGNSKNNNTKTDGDGKNPVEDEESEDSDEQGISAHDLQWGNDFDHAIRDRLPPGFGTAMNIVRWWIDPGLEGDAYADNPYLYGPALSSFNAVHVGACPVEEDKGGIWVTEGGGSKEEQQQEEVEQGGGLQWRKSRGAPDDRKGRMKWALRNDAKDAWTWEYGRTYGADFHNGYLDFTEFALRLPGFHLPIMKYWDGQPLRPNHRRSHTLRYVLRNRKTNDVYLVVVFTLYRKEDVNEDGSLKPAALQQQKQQPPSAPAADAAADTESGEEHGFDEEKAIEEARRKLSGVDVAETKEDDGGGDDGGVD